MKSGEKEFAGLVKKLSTEKAYVFWALGVVFGAIAKTFFSGFPFIEFSGVWTVGFLGVGAKRLIQKRAEFGGKNYWGQDRVE